MLGQCEVNLQLVLMYLFYKQVKRPLMVHMTMVLCRNETVIITAYEPDPLRWRAGFKERMKS